jgi:hypothetical protein
MFVRIKYNGDFVNLPEKTIKKGSAIQDNPSKVMSAYDIADTQDAHDITFDKFKIHLDSLLVPRA